MPFPEIRPGRSSSENSKRTADADMPVMLERRGVVVVAQFDRNEKRNAINAEMTKAIDSALPLNVGREVLLITDLRWWSANRPAHGSG